VGSEIDSFNGVAVYYNGDTHHVLGRHRSETGYNIGLKWQCCEFVKRYYLVIHNHEFPDPYGNAVDFYDPSLGDGVYNKTRGLYQYSASSAYDISVGDIIVYKGRYGHVAIVTEIFPDKIELIQQNTGTCSRVTENMTTTSGHLQFENPNVMGFLSLKNYGFNSFIYDRISLRIS